MQFKTPDDGQRNCPKCVEFLDKNKFRKLVLLLVLLKGKSKYQLLRLLLCRPFSVSDMFADFPETMTQNSS
jgi:hypothetical protein